MNSVMLRALGVRTRKGLTREQWLELIRRGKGSVCTWCGKGGRLTKDHLRPKAFGGKGAYNIVPACGPCNNDRGIIVSLYLQYYRAAVLRPSIVDKTVRNLVNSRARFEKWVALEKEKIGWSPTEELGTPNCPFPIDCLTPKRANTSFWVMPGLGLRESRRKRGRSEAKQRAIAYQQWEDDGGSPRPEFQLAAPADPVYTEPVESPKSPEDSKQEMR